MADVLKHFIWKLVNGSCPTDHQTRENKGSILFKGRLPGRHTYLHSLLWTLILKDLG